MDESPANVTQRENEDPRTHGTPEMTQLSFGLRHSDIAKRHKEDERIRRSLEATRLSFGLHYSDVEKLTRDAADLGLAGVCVPIPGLVVARHIAAEIRGWKPDLVTVINFPLGTGSLEVATVEAALAGRKGATHLDVVIPGGRVFARDWVYIRDFITSIRAAAEDAAGRTIAIKAILETAAIEDRELLHASAQVAIDSGVNWLKTSTGYHPKGGATTSVVHYLRALAPPEVGIKASGGIRTREDCLRMLEAGADRIGTSSPREILYSV